MNEKLIALAVIVELLKDRAFNNVWSTRSPRQQDSIKTKLEKAIRAAIHEPTATASVLS